MPAEHKFLKCILPARAFEAVKNINGNDFILWHLILPGTLLFAIAVGIEYFNIDYFLSRPFFDTQNNTWPFKDFWLTKTLLHDWAQNLCKFIGVSIFLILLLSLIFERLKKYTKLLSYLFIASISGPIIIGILKNTTHIYTPWRLSLFGGDKPYIRLFDKVDPSLPIGHGFPGGHSGGGFAFVSLYYILLMVNPKYKFYGLGAGLLLGAIFSLTQVMRGAHFLSHDIFSLLICWSACSLLFILFYKGQFTWPTKTAPLS